MQTWSEIVSWDLSECEYLHSIEAKAQRYRAGLCTFVCWVNFMTLPVIREEQPEESISNAAESFAHEEERHC